MLYEYTFDPYGTVRVSAQQLLAHSVNRVGHQGLFVDRLDPAISPAQAEAAFEQYKTAANSRGIAIGFRESSKHYDGILVRAVENIDGLHALTMSDELYTQQGNYAWLQGAIDAGVPIYALPKKGQLLDALAHLVTRKEYD